MTAAIISKAHTTSTLQFSECPSLCITSEITPNRLLLQEEAVSDLSQPFRPGKRFSNRTQVHATNSKGSPGPWHQHSKE